MNTLHTKKNLTVGILAHVDAGKTTLAEAILYTCGKIRNLGRVDHKDAFLDNFALERERGITIFSKQAQITLGDMNITLLDTPGHVDFSAEMERTLQVLDYAILVISGADGVQGHVLTLWRLLARYDIPVFLFINKMDQEGTDKERLLEELQTRLDEHCILCGHQAEEAPGARELFLDAAAMCSESLMEEYLETGELSEESLAEAIADRQIFPCYFGSALKLVGVEEMLQGLQRKVLLPEYPSEFGARVFKIARDQNGKRLTYLKVTGGCLRVKMLLSNASSAESVSQIWEEKADGLRIYEGAGYLSVEEVSAGGVCAVTGLTRTFAGQGLGYEEENALPVLEPVLTYQLLLPEESDVISVLGQLRQLEEEEPLLHILWKEEVQEIHVQVMGEVQLEILRSLLQERFGLEADFGTGSIVYKETLAEPVVGIGHFEPLRHYAEVQLLLEPGERGSGLQFASVCSEDVLDKNWQRLVMTHLEEKKHMGVLTGSEITDLKIVLLAGRAHQKHTEGGDFRQATYRAVRQGLRRGKNVLLEPVFSFVLEVPTEMLGRAMSDVQRMYGSFEVPETMGETSILRGKAPVATMRDYQREVNAYTKGHGRLSVTVSGYEPCHNAEEVVQRAQYDPEQDLANPTGSVYHIAYELLTKFAAAVVTEALTPEWGGNMSYVSSSRVSVNRLYTLDSKDDFSTLLQNHFEKKRLFLDDNSRSIHWPTNTDYIPDSFMNRWVEKFKIGKSISLDVDKEGLGVQIRLHKTAKDKGRLLADEGYGITQLVSILLQIETAILSAQGIKANRYYGLDALDNYKSDKFQYEVNTISIEEPEIHLHPKYQSLLADMLVEAYQEYNIHFVVETHSEYLIRKLQLIVSGHVEDVHIDRSAASIYYINSEDDKSKQKVKRIGICSDGYLDDSFGEGFYDEATKLSRQLM